ncbi:MAG: DUF87 domain-containing protein [Nocardioides sp.]
MYIGSLAETVTGKTPRVWLSTGKEQVTAIVGKRGSGKSFTLGVVLEGLTAGPDSPVGRQVSERAVLLFDPLDIYWTTRLTVAPSDNAEAQRHYGMAKAAGLDGLEFAVDAWIPGVASRRVTDPAWFSELALAVPSLGIEEWELLLGVNVAQEPMGQALADALDLVRSQGYQFAGGRVEPTATFGMDELASALSADELAGVYHAETLRALRQRLRGLSATGLFDSVGTRIQTILTAGRAAVILLNRLPQSYRDVVVSVLTRMVIETRSSTAFAEKRLALEGGLDAATREQLVEAVAYGLPRTVVMLDEGQTFLSPGAGSPVRELFVRLVKEGRNMGLSAIIATQQPSALDKRILSQVETFVAHQSVTEQDVRAVRENLKAPVADSMQFGAQTLDDSALLRQLPPGVCLVSSADMNSTPRRAIIVSVRPRATVHGGIEI